MSLPPEEEEDEEEDEDEDEDEEDGAGYEVVMFVGAAVGGKLAVGIGFGTDVGVGFGTTVVGAAVGVGVENKLRRATLAEEEVGSTPVNVSSSPTKT